MESTASQGTRISNDLKSRHLFLLVGENTLPNWVAARLLLAEGGTVHLVRTGRVENQSRFLRERLSAFGIRAEYVDTPTDADGISSNILSYFLKAVRTRESVGLNYTGGTKLMAVHSHRAICEATNGSVTLSYLDADTLRLRFDYGCPDGFDVSTDERISLDTLLRLHDDYGEDELKLFDTAPVWPEAASVLAEVVSAPAGGKRWRKLCELIKNAIDVSARGSSGDIQRKLADCLDDPERALLSRLDDRLITAPKEIPGPGRHFERLPQLRHWVNGHWLEHHLLDVLMRLAPDVGFNKDGIGKNPRIKSASGRNLEADVLALRGYELFYFSCYTGRVSKTAKLKLFEAVIRARQLGGDEASVALVSFEGDPDGMQKQAAADWRLPERIRVFGRKHVNHLDTELRIWLREPANARK